jgi:hypothetical protein
MNHEQAKQAKQQQASNAGGNASYEERQTTEVSLMWCS